MARGDTVTVKYAGPSGTESQIVKARSVGAVLEVDSGKAADAFVMVTETMMSGKVVQTARFSKFAILSIVEGHEDFVRGKGK